MENVTKKTLKITAISDTHTYHDQIKIEPCDILIHSGDFSFRGGYQETIDFLKWIEKQPAKHRIWGSGNHDFMGQNEKTLFKGLIEEYAPTSTYLEHEGINIEGLSIWLNPFTPTYYDWAFMADPGSSKMLSSLSIIPSNLDILITHGPAYGILDLTKNGERVGCQDLLNELERIRPRYHIFGHIHESAGQLFVDGTTHINASILDENYKVKNSPIILDF